MNTPQRITLAQLDTQAFALMGRLHVALRRETGRVIDIEYMRHDPDYCKHVLELAGQLDHAGMQEICMRLREIFFSAGGLFMAQESRPLLTPRASVPGASAGAPAPVHAAGAGDSSGPQAEEKAYVGRLR